MEPTIKQNKTIWIDTEPKFKNIIKEISVAIETPAGIVDKLYILIKPYNSKTSKDAYIKVTKLMGKYCDARTRIELNKRPENLKRFK